MIKNLMCIAICLCTGFISGCLTKPPMLPSATSAYENWDKYQNDLASYLNDIIGRPNNMRIVPATLIYPIGTIVRQNSLSEISKNCHLSSAPPSAIKGPTIPSVHSTRKFGFSIDPGSFITKVYKELRSVNLNYNRSAELTATIIDMSTKQIPEDETLSILKDELCISTIAAKDISVIRGYISARYEVTAGGGIKTGSDVKILKSDLLDIKYENTDSFEVKEKEVSEKFAILADGYAKKEVIISGTFLQEENKDSGECVEGKEIIVFGKPRRKSDGKPSLSDFASCNELNTYLSVFCGGSQPESINIKACSKEYLRLMGFE